MLLITMITIEIKMCMNVQVAPYYRQAYLFMYRKQTNLHIFNIIYFLLSIFIIYIHTIIIIIIICDCSNCNNNNSTKEKNKISNKIENQIYTYIQIYTMSSLFTHDQLKKIYIFVYLFNLVLFSKIIILYLCIKCCQKKQIIYNTVTLTIERTLFWILWIHLIWFLQNFKNGFIFAF